MMKISFLVQNNSKNHLLNAVIAADILRSNGVDVHTCFMSDDIEVPELFYETIGCDVIKIKTPLLYKRMNKKNYLKSFFNNIFNVRKYIKSANIIREHTKDDDYIFNFYEPINFYYQLCFKKPKTKTISISSDYWFLHKESHKPKWNLMNRFLYYTINRMTSFRSYKTAGMSMIKHKDDQNVCVIPPLIDRKIFKIIPELNDYFLVSINDRDQLANFLHKISDEQSERFIVFSDYEDNISNNNVTYFDLKYDLFLKYLAYSKGYISSTNFYLISLSYWMGKSTFVVPDKDDYSELCNFVTYINNEISIGNRKEVFFDFFNRYHDFFNTDDINDDYKMWVLQTEKKILQLLT